MALSQADLSLLARDDKGDLPKVKPIVTRVQLFAGHRRCCGQTTTAPLPKGLEIHHPSDPSRDEKSESGRQREYERFLEVSSLASASPLKIGVIDGRSRAFRRGAASRRSSTNSWRVG